MTNNNFNTPILFLVFNRPETTVRVFESIRTAKPKQLFIAADGPRPDRESEADKCARVKDIVSNIDWPCEVKTLYRTTNLGCGKAVSSAITWFFENVEEGIILEDDCLPHFDFFNYCQELLAYYRDDQRVMHISGDQFVPRFNNGASYYFAQIQHCWGWASWANRWKQYDFNLINFSVEDFIEKFPSKAVENYWVDILRSIKNHSVDTWDYQWSFAIIKQSGFCINPSKNLVSNIGFGSGTHTKDKHNPWANLRIFEMKEIIHPRDIVYNQKAVDYIYRHHYGIKKSITEIFSSIFRRINVQNV